MRCIRNVHDKKKLKALKVVFDKYVYIVWITQQKFAHLCFK